MSKWKKLDNPEKIIGDIGEGGLTKFLAGEIFIVRKKDTQRERILCSFSLYENIEDTHTTWTNTSWLKKKKMPSYLLLATYSDGSRGIFHNNFKYPSLSLDSLGFTNRWECKENVSEFFCYDDDRELFIRFLDFLDNNTELNPIKDEIYNYFDINLPSLRM